MTLEERLGQLAAYNVIGIAEESGWQSVVHGLNARTKTLLFQNTATPTPLQDSASAIITIGEYPWILNQLELGATVNGQDSNSYPNSYFLGFNLFDSDNEGIFGGPIFPRGSTIFGSPNTIAYAIQPVKVFLPKTRMKLSWNNLSATAVLGFEMFFHGIEVSTDTSAKRSDSIEERMRDLIEEMNFGEMRTR